MSAVLHLIRHAPREGLQAFFDAEQCPPLGDIPDQEIETDAWGGSPTGSPIQGEKARGRRRVLGRSVGRMS